MQSMWNYLAVYFFGGDKVDSLFVNSKKQKHLNCGWDNHLEKDSKGNIMIVRNN